MTKWEEKLNESEKILLWWYRKIGEAGHGDLTIHFEKLHNKIDIKPSPNIRTEEEQRIFEK